MGANAPYCVSCRGRVTAEVVDFAMYKTGGVYELLVCPVGHRIRRAVALEGVPEDLAMRRVYMMGAAAGFGAGVHREGQKFARAIQILQRLGTTRGTLRMMLGVSRRTLGRILRGEYPGHRQANLSLVVDNDDG